MPKHFKMYVTITDIIDEKRIDLAYLIWGREVAIVNMFSKNVIYKIREPVVIMAEDVSEYVIKTNKLAGIIEVVLILNELNNTDNLEDRRLNNVLLSCHVTDSDEFMRCEPVTLQYKKHKNWEFTSLTLRIMNQKSNSITDVWE